MSRFEIKNGKSVKKEKSLKVRKSSGDAGDDAEAEVTGVDDTNDLSAVADSDVAVGVSKSGKYHKKECRFYASTEEDMPESEAVAKGYVCGNCCAKK